MSIEKRVKEIIVEQLGVNESEVNPEAKFVDDLGADSLDLVELVMALEEEYNIEISDEDAEKILTVGDAIEYIKTHVHSVKRLSHMALGRCGVLRRRVVVTGDGVGDPHWDRSRDGVEECLRGKVRHWSPDTVRYQRV